MVFARRICYLPFVLLHSACTMAYLGRLGRLLIIYTKSFAFVLFVFTVAYLVFSTPAYNNKACLPLDPRRSNIQRLCKSIFDGKKHVTDYASQYAWCRRSDVLSEDYYISALANVSSGCGTFLLKHGYLSHRVTADERNFSLAFSILVHENIEQMERMLRLIYRPHNLYCIHVDAKSSAKIHHAVRAIASCFSNVFVASKLIDVHWAEFSLLEAQLICLRELFERPEQWRYYINVMGREFPLRTNQELVKIFTAYNGSNDVDGSFHRFPVAWSQYVWRNENWQTSQLKSKPPHKFLIAKGSAHSALSRDFVDFALNDPRAIDLLEWMKDIRAPDEFFYATLNHNPLLEVPGAYKGDPDLKQFYTRLKVWQNKTEVCHGQWVRFVCNFGIGDVFRIKSAKELFLNKIRLEQDPVAFHCLELWYHDRINAPKSDKVFNLAFYENLPFVRNHVE